MREIWSKFPAGRGEVNIWARNLVDFKRSLKRREGLWVFTEAYIGRWDLVAYELYGDQYLWWVVPLANDIIDLFSSKLVGAFLKVPDFRDVWEWISFG